MSWFAGWFGEQVKYVVAKIDVAMSAPDAIVATVEATDEISVEVTG